MRTTILLLASFLAPLTGCGGVRSTSSEENETSGGPSSSTDGWGTDGWGTGGGAETTGSGGVPDGEGSTTTTGLGGEEETTSVPSETGEGVGTSDSSDEAPEDEEETEHADLWACHLPLSCTPDEIGGGNLPQCAAQKISAGEGATLHFQQESTDTGQEEEMMVVLRDENSAIVQTRRRTDAFSSWELDPPEECTVHFPDELALSCENDPSTCYWEPFSDGLVDCGPSSLTCIDLIAPFHCGDAALEGHIALGIFENSGFLRAQLVSDTFTCSDDLGPTATDYHRVIFTFYTSVLGQGLYNTDNMNDSPIQITEHFHIPAYEEGGGTWSETPQWSGEVEMLSDGVKEIEACFRPESADDFTSPFYLKVIWCP